MYVQSQSVGPSVGGECGVIDRTHIHLHPKNTTHTDRRELALLLPDGERGGVHQEAVGLLGACAIGVGGGFGRVFVDG